MEVFVKCDSGSWNYRAEKHPLFVPPGLFCNYFVNFGTETS